MLSRRIDRAGSWLRCYWFGLQWLPKLRSVIEQGTSVTITPVMRK